VIASPGGDCSLGARKPKSARPPHHSITSTSRLRCSFSPSSPLSSVVRLLFRYCNFLFLFPRRIPPSCPLFYFRLCLRLPHSSHSACRDNPPAQLKVTLPFDTSHALQLYPYPRTRTVISVNSLFGVRSLPSPPLIITHLYSSSFPEHSIRSSFVIPYSNSHGD